MKNVHDPPRDKQGIEENNCIQYPGRRRGAGWPRSGKRRFSGRLSLGLSWVYKWRMVLWIIAYEILERWAFGCTFFNYRSILLGFRRCRVGGIRCNNTCRHFSCGFGSPFLNVDSKKKSYQPEIPLFRFVAIYFPLLLLKQGRVLGQMVVGMVEGLIRATGNDFWALREDSSFQKGKHIAGLRKWCLFHFFERIPRRWVPMTTSPRDKSNPNRFSREAETVTRMKPMAGNRNMHHIDIRRPVPDPKNLLSL